MIDILAQVAFWLALIPAVVFLANLREFRRPPRHSREDRDSVSILIPARDEEENIEGVLKSVLASEGVDFEIVVLDDHSTDRTVEIVQTIAEEDSRVRLEHAPPLPSGWAGKQHACACLAEHARNEILFFLDADVRIQPQAVGAMVDFLDTSGSQLVSGFPEQELRTSGEKLLVPLIHFILLGFLSMRMMRMTKSTGCGAGWGGLFVTRRADYNQAGGHSAIRNTFHDGIRLPRLYRRAGMQTDFCNLTGLVTCRMYRDFGGVWKGLGKNATEGIASPGLIGPFSFLLFGGHVLPWLLLPFSPLLAGAAILVSLFPRLAQAILYRLSIGGALLHPVGIGLFLAIQWEAFYKDLRGIRPTWRGRALDESLPG
ncbi:MAG: glycosyltransferase family 2 protein [Verrucomicrobiota bacterium]